MIENKSKSMHLPLGLNGVLATLVAYLTSGREQFLEIVTERGVPDIVNESETPIDDLVVVIEYLAGALSVAKREIAIRDLQLHAAKHVIEHTAQSVAGVMYMNEAAQQIMPKTHAHEGVGGLPTSESSIDEINGFDVIGLLKAWQRGTQQDFEG
jgi:hypothetical protein